ncbi:MAG: aminoacyl-tRNA deacylase [Anaerolineae bacterium]|nr:aminoacyl-tRNA deacylase [Anaerolineae bacterium]
MPDAEHKTNAMRLLEAQGIPYRAHYFSDEIHSAEGVAETLGFPPGQVFKTLVVMPEGGTPRPLLAIVPADRELDLKALAKAAGEKRIRMAAHREAEQLTGLLVGGISALALLQKPWRVFLDSSANAYAEILVSAGQRGINLQLAVAGLVKLTKARVSEISRPPATGT